MRRRVQKQRNRQRGMAVGGLATLRDCNVYTWVPAETVEWVTTELEAGGLPPHPVPLSRSTGGQVAAAGAGENIPTFSLNAYNGGVVDLGWGLPVVFDLTGAEVTDLLPALHQHDRRAIVGHTTKVTKTGRRLSAVGLVSGIGVSAAADLVTITSQRNFPWQASIGALVTRLEEVAPRGSVTVNGSKFQGPLFVVRACILKEISFVDFGADGTTSARVSMDGLGVETMPTFSEWLQAAHPGTNFATLTRERQHQLTTEYYAAAGGSPAGSNNGGAAAAGSGETSGVADGSGLNNGQAGGYAPPIQPTATPNNSGAQASANGAHPNGAQQQGAATFPVAVGGLPAAAAAFDQPGGTPQQTGASAPRLAGAYAAAAGPDAGYLAAMADMARARQRVAQIEQLCGAHSAVCAAILQDEAAGRPWSDEQVRNRVALADIQAGRPMPPRVGGGQAPGLQTAQIEAAMCLAAGVTEQTVTRHYGERVLEQADRMRHVGLRGAVELYARASGQSMPDWNMGRREWMQAAMSLVDLPNMFESVANRTLLELYENEPPTAPAVGRNAPVSDFRKVTRFRLDGGEPWAEVNKDGKLESSVLGKERPFEVQATTFGQILRFDRKDIINDDLGAMQQIMAILAQGAAWTLDKEMGRLAYLKTTFVDTVNYFKGATWALSVEALNAAWDAMLIQKAKTTRTNTTTRRILPRMLMVGANYDRLAGQLLEPDRLAVVGHANTPKLASDTNFFKGRLMPKTFLEAGNTDWFGTTATGTHYKPFDDAWWLVAGANSAHAPFEISWLNNRRVPTIESEREMGDGLGFILRGYIDFGLSPLDSNGWTLFQPSET